MSAQDESNGRSYLSKLSPWSRSPSIMPSKGKEGEPSAAPLQEQKGADHIVSHRHRISLKQYPKDCPHLRPQWFHAVDVPKRRPHPAGEIKDEKPVGIPKKYAAFSTRDSKAIEAAFQKLLEEEDSVGKSKFEQQRGSKPHPRSDRKPNTTLEEEDARGKIKVPVNEDYLFDVDVEQRELAPAYWLGPVYDVRRGTWFYQDGSTQRPCDENLSMQLEEGYLKLRPWRFASTQATQTKPRSASNPKGRPASWAPGNESATSPHPVSAKHSSSDLRKQAGDDSRQPVQVSANDSSPNDQSQNTHRLFGAHMNSVVTYQDATTAWLLTDDFMARMNYTMYQRFAGGGHFGGLKLTRGYINPTKKTNAKDDKSVDDKQPVQEAEQQIKELEEQANRPSTSETKRQTLQRHMSSLLEDATGETQDEAKQDEELRKRDEREIEDDYRDTEGEDQGREIEHLILVTHGIGQRLGLRLESVNFVHDVNTLRKTLKAVYADSPDLRALNAELGESETVNSRVQVLPICWRHLLDFPKQSLRHNRKEHDIADNDNIDDEDYPSLEDITVEGVSAVRNLITDLALDILLYDSPAYKDHISRIVLNELNRIYHLFMDRNPTFNGKISLIGHSLGSAIMFDILSRQDQPPKLRRKGDRTLKLDFPVEDFYALGSPIGLFQMLGGRTIAARPSAESRPRAGSSMGSMDDPMLGAAPAKKLQDPHPVHIQGENPVTRPKCAQLFNIFHPTDPISYRLEPLISPAMATLKPQPLPYTKRGIFGAPVGQGLTGIGARVSQSVSSMWSSMASSLLTRGLGYSEDTSRVIGNTQGKSTAPLSMGGAVSASSTGAGTNVAAGVVPPTAPLPAEGTEIARIGDDTVERVAKDAQAASDLRKHPPTLIDSELETLFGDFEKRRKSVQNDSQTRDLGAGAIKGSPEWAEAEERGKRLRKEEEKVRKLNSNGRVDYAIQEGAFDINLIAAIASHLSYWSDEDVSHFIISQLLSRHRIVRPRAESAGKVSTGR
ncbi:related to phosphatidic acid-preferring phospholipase A1, contains DDHD domain [Lecanosticta acicola]|uniref:Related to phosphatidic acid-preferring phospholipase A1, contains DDHD domain n=1 Tax=Lecanosticta acicola TaxID=111012 RepID=A0AAI8YV44_9PEZI|nr:related to phosphatidic acid-preferring phospholipase A1, contains DDHD domain [Lecanosticta acicola]